MAYAIPVVAAALAAGIGVLRTEAPRPDWFAVACAATFGLVAAGLAATGHDSEVSTGHLVAGMLAVPLVYYYGTGVLLTLELVNCPPDAYECPI